MNEDELRDEELKAAVQQNFGEDKPSSNFTHLVMQQVEAAEIKKASHQKPLVGFVGWMIFGAFAVLMVFSVLAQSETSFKLELPQIDMDKFWNTYSLIPAVLFAVAILVFFDTLVRRKKLKSNQ